MDDRHRDSARQERDGARRFGGTRNPGSGNGDLRKNDVRTPGESIEFKTTRAASYRLRPADLQTAATIALLDGRRMVLGLEFVVLEGLRSHRFVVLPEDDYLELTGR